MTTAERTAAAEVPLKLLGARIRRARKSAQLSHDKLGLQVGATRQHLIRLEKGLHRPSDALLHAIALATEHPVTFFTKKAMPRKRVVTSIDADVATAALESLVDVLTELVRERLAVDEIEPDDEVLQ